MDIFIQQAAQKQVCLASRLTHRIQAIMIYLDLHTTLTVEGVGADTPQDTGEANIGVMASPPPAVSSAPPEFLLTPS